MSNENEALNDPGSELAAITAIQEPDVRLGSLAIHNPTELVSRASELATALADIINKRELYSIIGGRGKERKKYVKCEGWTTMGAMLGVFPVEDYCRKLSDGNGFEAKINLVRSKDGMIVGSASAECTHDESNWRSRDSYSLRSMALTRATSKAFRLSFSWIIKLAGFEPTPAEEMVADEDASVTRQQVEQEIERQQTEPKVPPDKYGDAKMLLAECKDAEQLNALIETWRDEMDDNLKVFVRTRAAAMNLIWSQPDSKFVPLPARVRRGAANG